MSCVFQVVVSCLLAVAAANPGAVLAPYHAGVIAAAPVAIAAPAVTSSQYHAQDELGQFSYGYAGGPSAKHEARSFDGVTRGGYSYVDAHGLVQSVNYVSDPVHGFRVAATNLPVAPAPVAVAPLPAPLPVADTPEVAAAKAAHFAAHAEANAHLARAKRQIITSAALIPRYVAPRTFAYHTATPVVHHHAYAAAPALIFG